MFLLLISACDAQKYPADFFMLDSVVTVYFIFPPPKKIYLLDITKKDILKKQSQERFFALLSPKIFLCPWI